VIVRVAVRAPIPLAVNVILTTQEPAFAATVPEQVLPEATAKSAALVPVMAGEPEIVATEAVPLVSVTVNGELVEFNSCPVVNVSGFGLTLTIGFAPVPDSVMRIVPLVP